MKYKLPPTAKVEIVNKEEILDWVKNELRKEGVEDFSRMTTEVWSGLVRIKNGHWIITIESGNKYTFTFNDKKHREHGPAVVSPVNGYYYKHGKHPFFPQVYIYYLEVDYTKTIFAFENRSYMIAIKQSTKDQSLQIDSSSPPRRKDIKNIINYILENYDITLADLLLSPDKTTREFAEIAMRHKL